MQRASIRTIPIRPSLARRSATGRPTPWRSPRSGAASAADSQGIPPEVTVVKPLRPNADLADLGLLDINDADTRQRCPRVDRRADTISGGATTLRRSQETLR